MLFNVINNRSLLGSETPGPYLLRGDWDDHGFKTSFYLVFVRENGEPLDIGPVKILRRGLEKGYVEVPQSFDALDSDYCSLGQDQNYYESLAGFIDAVHEPILIGLRDCVNDRRIFEEFRFEPGMGVSLLRKITVRNVTETFRGILRGQASLTSFRFSYTYPPNQSGEAPVSLKFAVQPNSMPPTNIHAVIGRNGVGKTTLLANLAKALCQPKDDFMQPFGTVEFDDPEMTVDAFWDGDRFTNLVTVAFSAFDPFRPVPRYGAEEIDITHSYIGLRAQEVFSDSLDGAHDLKSYASLSNEFSESLKKCASAPRLRRWRDAIEIIESDPLFCDADLSRLIDYARRGDDSSVRNVFDDLSSGHKIVLLTVTKLVELVDDRTLVLFDEPESHLHPPLLASFLRAISSLLILRNGAAIIATHSPVVLQEVPATCVWILRRSGDVVVSERPSLETFGENVSVLTREVFGLEVTQSGFHKMISDALAGNGGSYEQAIDDFNGQLGAEARAVALAISRSMKS
ncbi:AAA family ATPase [Undibacter mobilis]|uniref:ATP-binding protein n=1 Tax=Undibacter mobilis TaxID=2292256 RepID=A0A371BC93_9BRAD|nr:AAA family ATPase [Undibacter mobilis]RDV05219.1 ATP-binding protein [Undibacter mobilis]